MTNALNISVVICTYNRAKILADTLVSFSKMSFSDLGAFELVIVDNNSNDETAEITKSFCLDQPYARYLYEEKPGLSHARNKGILESSGNVIVFIDDDVYLDQNWLHAVERVFANHPDAAAFGGKSIPQFENGRPEWLKEWMAGMYGDTGFGDDPRWVEFPKIPFGLNMGFRRWVFDQIGLFNPKLGRVKGSLLSNEEVDIFWRIAQAGLKVYYAPEALLYHRIPASRSDPKWIIERYYWQGISTVVFDQIIHPQSKLALLRGAMKCAWQAFQGFRGGHVSPRQAYWHYLGLSVEYKCLRWYDLGVARQKLREAIS